MRFPGARRRIALSVKMSRQRKWAAGALAVYLVALVVAEAIMGKDRFSTSLGVFTPAVITLGSFVLLVAFWMSPRTD
jgi:hypothetical protein